MPGAKEMAQLKKKRHVYNCKELSPVLKNPPRKARCMLVIPVLGGGDRQIPGTCWPARLAYLENSRPVRGLASQKKRYKPEEQHTRLSSGLYTCACAPAHTCVHMCTYKENVSSYVTGVLCGQRWISIHNISHVTGKNITGEPESIFCVKFSINSIF